MHSVYLLIPIAIFGIIYPLPTIMKRHRFFFQIGVISSTAWLESNLSWRGILILTEPKSFFEAQRSTRNPRSKVLHACLSTDTDTKEVKIDRISFDMDSRWQVERMRFTRANDITDKVPPRVGGPGHQIGRRP